MKKEKYIYFKFLFVFLFLLGFLKSNYCQEKAKVSGPREKTYKEELRSNKKIRAERKERAEKKAVKKHHKRIQTKKVRKRMRESRKLANRHNENKSEFFVKKWFKKH